MEEKYQELYERVTVLEEKVDAVIEVINHLMEVIYEPSYIKKIDKLVSYGKREADKR